MSTGDGGSNDGAVNLSVSADDKVFVAGNYVPGAARCADGSFSPAEVRIQELSASGNPLQTSDPCDGIFSWDPHKTGDMRQDLAVNPLTGNPYLLDNATGEERYDHFSRLYVFGPSPPAPDLALDPDISNVSSDSGTISGTIDPNGPGTSYPDASGAPSSYTTTYKVQYKKSTDSDWTDYNPETPIGSGTDPIPFSVGVAGLDPKTPYDLKVVATKPLVPGGTVTAQRSFTTAGAPPAINAFHSSGVTVDSADLHALVNPQGTDSTYHFEYGTSTNYDHSTPEVGIGDSLVAQSVTAHITGLQDTTYHFRVVAHNSLGTTTSEDQTFVFHPPACPNQTLRQQTNAAYLPDCRAYELVSPENAGGTTLYTGGPQSAYATSPSRLAFVGEFGAIPGAGGPPADNAGDLYLASRGASGWATKYIGLPADQAGCMGGRPITTPYTFPTTVQNDVFADPGLDRIADWNLGNPMECTSNQKGLLSFYDINTAAEGSNAPYVWSADGDLQGRWPTSMASISGAKDNFACPQDPNLHPYPKGFLNNVPVDYFCSTNVTASKDLSHFVFSTQRDIYGGGADALDQAPGSAYDNDTATGEINLVSLDPNGDPIAQEPGTKAGPDELIQFPHVSNDGSRILMGTQVGAPCRQLVSNQAICPVIANPTHLYMRVNDAVSYDVSADYNGVGHAVTYVGSSDGGTKVFFTTSIQMSADDTDTSVDLYQWDENNGAPTLTRVSAGDSPASGNTDNCVSTWSTNCDVKPYVDAAISTTRGNKGGLGGWTQGSGSGGDYYPNPNPGHTDNSIAAISGDIYFYSPEQLISGKGVPGRENVYAYHDGALEFVASLKDDPYCIDFGQGLDRTGKCSDGAMGRLQVTPDGRYAAFITTTKITAYDNAGFAEIYRFDADSGRVQCMSCRPDGSPPASDVLGSMGGRFIADDGRVFFDSFDALEPRDSNQGKDTYEFVDGKAQLITTGTGISSAAQYLAAESVPGLYGVSADGTDAYFATTETLVGQDRNGGQLKFYDARTNGGFPFNPPPAPCQAADECHGALSQGPGALAKGTGSNLGSSGNYSAPAKAKGKKKHKTKRNKHRKHKKHRKQSRHRRHHG
jgi:hypothetical protein